MGDGLAEGRLECLSTGSVCEGGTHTGPSAQTEPVDRHSNRPSVKPPPIQVPSQSVVLSGTQ